ncbi:MAG: hypothetical protein JHC98_04755 [Thermoleophilaceae bacterium]|nr:hypothetical protein [Thermoleophilaceae bacterium]
MSFHPSKSLRLAFPALVVFALITIALALPRSADAAPKCGGNSKIWVVNGKKVCLKTARTKAGHAGVQTSSRLARWFAEVSRPAAGSRLKVPAKLRAAAPKASAAAVKLATRAASMDKKPRIAANGKRAFAAAVGAVVDTISVKGPSQTLPSGVELTSQIDVREFADGSKKFNVTVDSSYNGYTVRYQPVVEEVIGVVPEVECPTAAGLLTIDHKSSTGGTMMVLKGKGVIAAVTEKFHDTLHATGHVGRDAKLHDVDARVTMKVEHYERGLQMVIQLAGGFSVPREGDPAATGPLSADIKLKVAGASSAEEKAAAKQLAAQSASSSATINSLGSQAEVARWRMMQDEYKWYSLPGRCANLRYSPDSVAKLAAGKSLQVSGRVEASSGGEASGEFTVLSVERGSFTVTKAQSDPGAPARFAAKAASPDAEKLTVGADVIATSTAGRAQWGWYAKDDLNLPEKISGTISSTSTTPGTYDFFHSWVVYTLDEVYVSDNGYISAWYKLTTADQDEVQQDIGVGCRWVGKGSGGNIEAGDIELNKPPGGEWTHAVMYDVEVPNTTFVPTDCGPEAPPSFTGTLVGFVNMAMLGGGFEPVGDGFHLDAVRTYTDPASQRSTVASWSLEPGDPQ